MDEAEASSNLSLENGQPAQTLPEDATSAIAGNHNNNKNEADRTPCKHTEPLSSLLGRHTLRYFQTADNEVIVAFLGALALLIYFILGRLGLLLIGLVSGFLLHEYWEGIGDHGAPHGGRDVQRSLRKKELGIEVASRLLDWTSQKAGLETDDDIEGAPINDPTTALDKSPFRPASAAAISNLIDAILRDYVK